MENVSSTSMNTGMRHEYYKHSGMFNPMGVIVILAIGAVGTVILSLIYSYATHYIPFVYLNILLTILFGVGVGALAGIGGIFFKIRNISIIGLISGLLGLFAEYCQWVFDILALTDGEFFLLNPVDIYGFIRVIGVTGVWSIRRFTPTGVVLYAVWFGEAAIIIGASLLIAIYMIKTKPFCERCDKWVTKEETLFPLNYADDVNGLKLKLEQGDFSALTSLGKAELNSNHYTKVTLKHCEQCKDLYLLSAWSIMVNKNKKDALETKSWEIVYHLIIDENVYNYLMEWNRSSLNSMF